MRPAEAYARARAMAAVEEHSTPEADHGPGDARIAAEGSPLEIARGSIPEPENAPDGPLYRWHWRVRLPDRRGQVFRVLARGKLNACLIEFADGALVVTSRNALRRA